MQLGMIGLGKMGANMAQRLLDGGHQVTGFDPNADARNQLEDKGGGSAASLDALKVSSGEGWAGGQDRYGAVTWVRIAAGAPASLRIETAKP